MTQPDAAGTGGGRRLRARYAFRGAGDEIDRTLPRGPDEPVVLHGVMRLRAIGLPRPAVLRLTPPRLVVLTHHALQPDRLLELPRGAVRTIEVRHGVLRLTWTAVEDGTERVTRLTGWTGRPAFDTTLRDVEAVAEVLHGWLAAPAGWLPAHRPHRHRR